MRALTTNLFADYDRATLVLLWRWQVTLTCGRVLTGLEDTRAEAVLALARFN